jgi:hypothetical protein
MKSLINAGGVGVKNGVTSLVDYPLPKKAVGEMIPVLFATRMAVPDSRKGAVKSTAASRSALTFDQLHNVEDNDPKKLDHLNNTKKSFHWVNGLAFWNGGHIFVQ